VPGLLCKIDIDDPVRRFQGGEFAALVPVGEKHDGEIPRRNPVENIAEADRTAAVQPA